MIYEYWFARMKNISDNKKKKLREAYGSAKEIYYIEETQLRLQNFLTKKDIEQLKMARKQKDLEEKYYNMEEKGIDFVPYFQKTYPKRLLELDGAPYAIYVKGKLPEEDRPSVAIIGARRCSNYGEGQALEYGKCLASAGVQIISGLALGIDGAGQRGALNGGGTTYGVLGCGVDICYPRENIGLYMDIQREGGIISEQIPGEPPMSYHFPLRNRIISGLADVVLVMEAKEKSGSLITTDMALEQGRDVYVVRSVDCVWIKINGEIYQIPMAGDEGVRSFRNMTWFEYNMWFEDKKALSDKNKENALGEHLASHARRKELMGQAKKEQEQLGKNKTKTAEKIRKNRLAEQQEKRKQERLSTLNITEEDQRTEREEYIDTDLDENDLIETVDENDDEMEDIDLAALL